MLPNAKFSIEFHNLCVKMLLGRFDFVLIWCINIMNLIDALTTHLILLMVSVPSKWCREASARRRDSERSENIIINRVLRNAKHTHPNSHTYTKLWKCAQDACTTRMRSERKKQSYEETMIRSGPCDEQIHSYRPPSQYLRVYADRIFKSY